MPPPPPPKKKKIEFVIGVCFRLKQLFVGGVSRQGYWIASGKFQFWDIGLSIKKQNVDVSLSFI